MYNYRGTRALTPTILAILISFNFLMLTFIDLIDCHPIVSLPIRKLLVLINQLFCGYLIDAKQMSNTVYKFFDEAEKANRYTIWNKIQKPYFADNDILKFYFQSKSRFHWRRR